MKMYLVICLFNQLAVELVRGSYPFPFERFFNTSEPSLIEFANKAYSCAKPYIYRKACCSCAKKCYWYGTCCIDKPWAESKLLIRKNMERYISDFLSIRKSNYYTELKCDGFDRYMTGNGYRTTQQYLMITSCPKNATQRDIENCNEPQFQASIDHIPVISDKYILYKNRYCARCNRVKDIVYLKTDIICKNIKIHQGKYSLFQCNMKIGITMGITFIHQYCNKAIWEKRCPSGHPLSDLCDAYVGLFFGFRNYHCWLCNNENNKTAISILAKTNFVFYQQTDQCPFIDGFPGTHNQGILTTDIIVENGNAKGLAQMFRINKNVFYPLLQLKCQKNGTYYDILLGGCRDFSCPYFYIRKNNYCTRLDNTKSFKMLTTSDSLTFVFIHNTSVTALNITHYLILPIVAIKTVLRNNDTAISIMEVKHSLLLARRSRQLFDKIQDIFLIVEEVILTSVPPSMYGNQYLALYNTNPNGTFCLKSEENIIFSTIDSGYNQLNQSIDPNITLFILFNSKGLILHSSYCKEAHTEDNCYITDIDLNRTLTILPKSSEFNFTPSMFKCIKQQDSTRSLEAVEIMDYLSVSAAWISVFCYIVIFVNWRLCQDVSYANHSSTILCISAFFTDFVFSIVLSMKITEIQFLEKACPYISPLMHFGYLNVCLWCFNAMYHVFVTLNNDDVFENKAQQLKFKCYCKSKFFLVLLPIAITLISAILHQTKMIETNYNAQQLCRTNYFSSQLYFYIFPILGAFIPLTVVLFLLLLRIQKKSKATFFPAINNTIKVVIACLVVEVLCYLPIFGKANTRVQNIVFSIYTVLKACRGIVLSMVVFGRGRQNIVQKKSAICAIDGEFVMETLHDNKVIKKQIKNSYIES